MAILGRPTLYAGEVYRMRTAEAIVTAYRARTRAKEWAKWAADNPAANSILIEAEMLANGRERY